MKLLCMRKDYKQRLYRQKHQCGDKETLQMINAIWSTDFVMKRQSALGKTNGLVCTTGKYFRNVQYSEESSYQCECSKAGHMY